MKLYAIRVFVDDWAEACDFYKNTLKLPLSFSNAESGWAEFDVGGSQLGVEKFRETDLLDEDLVGRFVGISLKVDNIDAKYEELKERGVEFISPPERQPWGGRLAHFKDTAGNVLTLLG